MVQDDVRRDLRELREQVEALREALSTALKPYRELAAYVERLQDLSKGYFRLLDLYQRYGSVSPDVVVPSVKDDISRHIIGTLFETPDRNISQITEAVKAKRGTASRRIVRQRLEDLVAKKILVAAEGPRGRTFRVSDEVTLKWAEILGLRPR
jgi:nitrate reductase assembly molybdenum cofactor insertion protein NarJ